MIMWTSLLCHGVPQFVHERKSLSLSNYNRTDCNSRILVVVGKDTWLALAFAVDQREDDQEGLAEVCAIQIRVDLTPQHHLFIQNLLPSRTNRTMTKNEVPLSLRGTEALCTGQGVLGT